VIFGLALLVLSWIASCLWHPAAPAAVVLSRYAFGTPILDALPGFPIIPWLGVYLLGTALGEMLGSCTEPAAVPRLLLRCGVASLVIGLPLGFTRRFVRVRYPDFFAAHDVIASFIALTRKFPPGPIYLLVFGGAGLLLIAAAFALSRSSSWWIVRANGALASLGRASFLVFILQGYVYYLLMPSLALRLPIYWPIYYVVSVGLFLLAAALWDAVGGNRYLTFGLWRTMPMVRVISERAFRVTRAPSA
jgi:uncharacterized membrane protein